MTLWADLQGLENEEFQAYKLGLIKALWSFTKHFFPPGNTHTAMKISNLILKYLIWKSTPQHVYLTKLYN